MTMAETEQYHFNTGACEGEEKPQEHFLLQQCHMLVWTCHGFSEQGWNLRHLLVQKGMCTTLPQVPLKSVLKDGVETNVPRPLHTTHIVHSPLMFCFMKKSITPGRRSLPEVSIEPPSELHLARINADLSPLELVNPSKSPWNLQHAYLSKCGVTETSSSPSKIAA